MSAFKLAMNCGLVDTEECCQALEQMEISAKGNIILKKEVDELEQKAIEMRAKIEEMEEENKKLKEDLGSKNVKGNRMVVRTSYNVNMIHKIPDGIDLEDKSVVEDWWVKWGTLMIKYVGKEEVEEIEPAMDVDDYDFKWGDSDLVDAYMTPVEYSEDEETDEETDEVKPFWEKPIERDENGNAIIEKKW